jgi:ketosteroid isomerase-like protein
MSEENIELVRRAFADFRTSGNLSDGVDVLWADDGEVWPAPGFPESGPFKGRDQIRRFFDGLQDGWKPDSFAVTLRQLEGFGDKVLVSLEWRGIGAASGIESSSDWSAVYTIRGRRFTRLEFFADHAAAISAAGLPKPD